MRPATRLSLLVPVLVVACATPGQVRRVETQVAMMETANARADSARAAEARAIQASIGAVLDRFALFSTNILATLDTLKRNDRAFADDQIEITRQLLAVQERLGQTQKDQRTLSSRIEEMTAAQMVRNLDTGTVAALPSDDALYQSARTSVSQMAYGVARSTFGELIRNYPTSPRVPDALLGIAQTFPVPESADSARSYFTRVFTEFPKSDAAPTAMFKLANLLLGPPFNDRVNARKFWQRVYDEYRGSTEATLAFEKLKNGL